MSIESTAYHEAGHAVSAIKLGARCTFASVHETGIGLGYARIDDANAFDDCVITVCGPIAAAMYTGKAFDMPKTEDPGCDFNRFAKGIEKIREEDPSQSIEELAKRATKAGTAIVDKHWKVIERLAKALIIAGGLDEQQILEIVNKEEKPMKTLVYFFADVSDTTSTSYPTPEALARAEAAVYRHHSKRPMTLQEEYDSGEELLESAKKPQPRRTSTLAMPPHKPGKWSRRPAEKFGPDYATKMGHAPETMFK